MDDQAHNDRQWMPADTKPRRQPTGDYRDDLIRGDGGTPRAILANAITALGNSTCLAGVIAFNEFTGSVWARRPPPWALAEGDWMPRPWNDHDDIKAAEWLQRDGVMVNPSATGDAVQAVAKDAAYHPVQEYLDDLRWDGQPRIDTWLSDLLGVMESDYTSAVGRCFMVSAVARAYQPGCKADSVLILEGRQGLGKSSAAKILGGDWFTDEIGEFGTKDAAEQTRGVWIVEVSEMSSLNRSEVARAKSFMSRRDDRYRPAYGRRVTEFPRQCVFIGTVNSNDYLRDETGGRRFWPVTCQAINLPALEAARDKLWAEAATRFHDREVWWLDTPALQAAAAEESAKRYQGDPWDGLIFDYLHDAKGNPKIRQRKDGTEGVRVTVDEILGEVLHVYISQRNQQMLTRVSRSLRSMGWERRQRRDGEGGARQWGYEPAEVSPPSRVVVTGGDGETQ